MADNQKYQGWANHTTWCINLWLSNEEGSYRYWTERAQAAWDDSDEDSTPEERSAEARQTLADWLKDEIEEANPLAAGGSMWSDLISSAIEDCDWWELANAWLDDVDGYVSQE
jgi:cytochrome P450